MKKIFILLTVLFTSQLLLSQTLSNKMYGYPKQKDAVKVKNSTLIIALLSEDKKVVKKLQNKPDELDLYIKSIKEYNDLLKNTVYNYWYFSDTSLIIELPEKEALRKMKKDKTGNYSVIGFDSYFSEGAGTVFEDTKYYIVTYGKVLKLLSPGNISVTYMAEYDDKLTEEMGAYAIIQMQYILNVALKNGNVSNVTFKKKCVKPNYKLLKDIKILIPEEFTLLTESEIKELYDYEFELVPYSRVKEAILKKEKGVAVTLIIPIASGSTYLYTTYVSNTETGMIYVWDFDNVSIGVKGIVDSGNRRSFIIKKSIKTFQKNAKTIE